MASPLDDYNRKRDFKKTREPAGKSGRRSKQPIFVVQKHAASHLHYDFRLEAGGRLLSWAVPKGPSLDPKDKRLAVQVEDHPLSYANFEGNIPEGQYGAGDVIVWDTGHFLPEGASAADKDIEKTILDAVSKGKLTFTLSGKKLAGSWSLVRMHTKDGSKKNWLLVKNDDQYASDQVKITDRIDSVLSRKSLEDGTAKNTAIKEKKVAKASTAKRVKVARSRHDFKPMLATLTDGPFKNDAYIFEPKLDGIRILAYLKGPDVRLLSRNGLDVTKKFPEIVRELASLDIDCVLDGELVALNEKGVPSFELLQARSILISKTNTKNSLALRYIVFDILQKDGEDITSQILTERKAILAKTFKPGRKKHLQLIAAYDLDGVKAFGRAVKDGMEGVVAKRLDGRYEEGRRSNVWLKVKAVSSSEFVICGYTAGSGGRAKDFGALVLAERQKDGKLAYAGKVGTGFNSKNMDKILPLLKARVRKTAPIDAQLTDKEVYWVKPELIAEIKYHEKTKQGLLRAPVFMHLREDIDADDLKPQRVKPASTIDKVASKTKPGKARLRAVKSTDDSIDQHPSKRPDTEGFLSSGTSDGICTVDNHRLKLSHLDKILWPGDKQHKPVTKGDYMRYLTEVSPHFLHFVEDRPLTMIRMPDGVLGQKFFQRHGDIKGTPEFVETVRYFSDGTGEDGQYMLCNNLATLLWCAQMGAVELHAAHTRATTVGARAISIDGTGSLQKVENSIFNYPDFLVLDLDPYLYSGKEKKGEEPELHKEGFKMAAQAAYWLKETLMSIGLSGFIKTSGKTGLHIYVPIERNLKYRVIRECAEVIGKHLLAKRPKEITMDWAVKKRVGRVFFDHNMNGRGKTLPVPYSVRATLQASVSCPIEWQELQHIYPTDFTVHTVPDRLKEVGDLWSDILKQRKDLKKILNL